jgi:hypothetical protein
MSELFDDISRIVGSPIPRRRALKAIGGALVGAVFGTSVLRNVRSAQEVSSCCRATGGSCFFQGVSVVCVPHQPWTRDKCEAAGYEWREGHSCCPDGHTCPPDTLCCGATCCDSNSVCLNDVCCPADSVCGDFTFCCPSGSICIQSTQECCPTAQFCPGSQTCCPSGTVCVNEMCCPTARVCRNPTTNETICCSSGVCCGGTKCCTSGVCTSDGLNCGGGSGPIFSPTRR